MNILLLCGWTFLFAVVEIFDAERFVVLFLVVGIAEFILTFVAKSDCDVCVGSDGISVDIFCDDGVDVFVGVVHVADVG